MNKDLLVSEIHYAIDGETSEDDISAAIDSMSEVDRALLFDRYNEAAAVLDGRVDTLIERRDNIWRLSITEEERDRGLDNNNLALSRVDLRFETELKALWQMIVAL